MTKLLFILLLLFGCSQYEKDLAGWNERQALYDEITQRSKEIREEAELRRQEERNKAIQDSLITEQRISYLDSVSNVGIVPVMLYNAYTTKSDNGVKPNIAFEVVTDRQIKYLKFKVSFYNRVMDKVYDKIRWEKSLNLSNTGPFDKGYTENTTWEEVYNDDIECMMIDSVLIDYMDDGYESFGGDDLKRLLIPEKFTTPPYSWMYITNICNYK